MSADKVTNAKTKSPYQTLLEYEQTRESIERATCCLRGSKAYANALEIGLRESRDQLVGLPSRLQHIADELRVLHTTKLMGRRIQYNRLTDCWSREQIDEYHAALGSVDFPNRDYYGHGNLAHEPLSVDAVEAGILVKCGDALYVTPNIKERFKNVTIGALLSGAFFGFIGACGHQRFDQRMEGMLIDLGVGITAGYFIGSSVAIVPEKNPFTFVAGKLQERAEYIRQRQPLFEHL